MRRMPARAFERAVRSHRRDVAEAAPEIRLGEDPEAVHRQRVATRRLRSLLRSAGARSADPDTAERLRRELRWLGRALGEVRDRDVLIANLQGELETLEEAAAFRGVIKALDGEREQARTKLLAVLDSPRYRRLLAELETPPMLRDGELRSSAVREHRRLRKAVAQLGDEPADEDLHKVRIRVKRARYAAEAAGARKRYVARAKTLQDVLGAHQDAVVAEKRIRSLVSRVRGGPRTALAAGRLIERQRAKRIAARQGWRQAWKRLERAAAAEWR
jgi:CHAD domain-containing protein